MIDLPNRDIQKHGEGKSRIIQRPHGYLEYRYAPGKVVELVTIFVDYEYQNNNIGSRMVEEVEDKARSLGMSAIYGFTRINNEAVHRFYARKNYTITAVGDFYGKGEHAVMIHKVLI